jgi:hypothetical protein
VRARKEMNSLFQFVSHGRDSKNVSRVFLRISETRIDDELNTSLKRG